MGGKLLISEEVIEYLGLDRQGLRDPGEALRWLRRSGQLKYTKVGRYVRYRQAWLDELIERNATRRPDRGG